MFPASRPVLHPSPPSLHPRPRPQMPKTKRRPRAGPCKNPECKAETCAGEQWHYLPEGFPAKYPELELDQDDCVCKRADCWRWIGVKDEAKKPGRRPAKKVKLNEPAVAVALVKADERKLLRPPILVRIDQIWGCRCRCRPRTLSRTHPLARLRAASPTSLPSCSGTSTLSRWSRGSEATSSRRRRSSSTPCTAGGRRTWRTRMAAAAAGAVTLQPAGAPCRVRRREGGPFRPAGAGGHPPGPRRLRGGPRRGARGGGGGHQGHLDDRRRRLVGIIG